MTESESTSEPMTTVATTVPAPCSRAPSGRARPVPPRRRLHRRPGAARRAARPRGGHPALFIALFFFVVNIGTLQNLTESNIPGFDYKAFQMPDGDPARVSPGSRGRRALVLDVQDGYFDRLLLTPIRRLAILLGHMVRRRRRRVRADHPDPRAGLRPRRPLRDRPARRPRVHPAGGAVEPGVHRVRLRHRAQDRQPGGGELQLPAVLPVPVPHLVVRAPRAS